MTASPLIRVLLVDDHMMVRRGLATFCKCYRTEVFRIYGHSLVGRRCLSGPWFRG